MGYENLEESTLHDEGEHDLAVAGAKASCLSRGAFSLTSAHYFHDIWHEKIISHNLRVALVGSIAMNYVNRGIALSELIKEGNLGLIHALENFELEGGSRFSTYAARCIRLKMERVITSQSETNLSSANSTIRPKINNLPPHRQRISSRCAKNHHQCA